MSGLEHGVGLEQEAPRSVLALVRFRSSCDSARSPDEELSQAVPQL
jgi:hypothetical protein